MYIKLSITDVKDESPVRLGRSRSAVLAVHIKLLSDALRRGIFGAGGVIALAVLIGEAADFSSFGRREDYGGSTSRLGIAVKIHSGGCLAAVHLARRQRIKYNTDSNKYKGKTSN
jgi:hypothetical protein